MAIEHRFDKTIKMVKGTSRYETVVNSLRDMLMEVMERDTEANSEFEISAQLNNIKITLRVDVVDE